MVKIYTRTGDKGNTSLFTGVRVRKDHQVIEAIGNLDELNAQIGLLHAVIWKDLSSHDVTSELETLEKIQDIIFGIGGICAGAKISNLNLPKETLNLEKRIDQLTESLPPLRNFILPRGSVGICQCHLARAVTRRAERSLIDSDQEIIAYINRLSDYLFTLARVLHQDVGEVKWSRNKV